MNPPVVLERRLCAITAAHQGDYMLNNDKILFRDIPSLLGPMIAGSTGKGVCFLEWHDRGGVDRIKERVKKRYRLPLLQGSDKYLNMLEKELTQYFKGKLKGFRVFIDVSGTPFEKVVWQQLLVIPYGEISTYGQIARQAGKPEAVRAVGRANGANYLSIVIPCHRVIRTDGELGGYGGKLWRKKLLLELESGLRKGG